MELIPLKSKQPTVTFIPIRATEFPFFTLTNSKKDFVETIDFDVQNKEGEIVGKWQVYPNTAKDPKTGKTKFGRPGIEAHKIWYLLIKPAIDSAKQKKGRIPQIIALGGVRECLTAVGWNIGGYQSRRLLRVLGQISAAHIVSDVPIPSGFDRDGKLLFKKLVGEYSRLSVYAIGNYHVEEDELSDNKYDFDLEDVIYIALDPLEIKMQEGEANNQKLIDNEYMFSSNAAGRRWYELLANKVYGVVKNKGQYFDVNYNWYIKRHHNLKRYEERFRVVRQMNRVVKDHIDIDYISKVEYQKFTNEIGEIDFRMRYYIGEEAKNSVKRIKGYLLTNTRKKPENQITRKPANQITGIQTLEEKLIAYFVEVFFEGRTPPIKQGSKAKDQARLLIQKYGEERARFIIEFAGKEAEKTNFKKDVQHFGALMQYENGAIARFEEHKKALKKQEETHKKENAKKEKDNLWKKHRELGTRLFNKLPEEEISKLQEKFIKKIKEREGWWSNASNSSTNESIFMILVNDEIKDYLASQHGINKSKSKAVS